MKSDRVALTAPRRASGPEHEQTRPDPSSDASTRHRVARSILEHGPSTAAELSARLGLTAAGVRRHLDVLVERGQLSAREQRVYGTRGRGRPAKVFALTDAGRDGFYAAYDTLAVQVLEFLAEHYGPAVPVVQLPGTEHHMMLDQPLVLAAALRVLVAGWRVSPRPARADRA